MQLGSPSPGIFWLLLQFLSRVLIFTMAFYSFAIYFKLSLTLTLKGPKREIYGLGIFAQIRPIWIGYLGTRPKNPKKLRLGPYIALYFPRFLCLRCR